MMTKLIAASVCTALAFLPPLPAQDNGHQETPSGDVDILLKDVGTFTLGGRSYSVRPSLGNETLPSEQWNFAFEPLLQPVRTDAARGGPVEVRVVGDSVRFQLALWTERARAAALDTIRRYYRAEAANITESNVRVMRISSLELSSPDVLLIDSGARMDPEVIYLGQRTGGVQQTV